MNQPITKPRIFKFNLNSILFIIVHNNINIEFIVFIKIITKYNLLTHQ
jgi:hypothetical protein